MPYGHEQITIKHPATGERIKVDKGIAPLLRELWRMEIYTLLSCENNVPEGYVWIDFLSGMDAERFLAAALPHRGEMSSRANSAFTSRDTPGAWLYEAHVGDISLIFDEDTGDVSDPPNAPPDFAVDVSIRFPRTDYRAVLRNVRHAAQAYK